jgi:hypothetical protein
MTSIVPMEEAEAPTRVVLMCSLISNDWGVEAVRYIESSEEAIDWLTCYAGPFVTQRVHPIVPVRGGGFVIGGATTDTRFLNDPHVTKGLKDLINNALAGFPDRDIEGEIRPAQMVGARIVPIYY